MTSDVITCRTMRYVDNSEKDCSFLATLSEWSVKRAVIYAEDMPCKAYFRSSMSRDQFKILLNFLRFDKDSRSKRKIKYLEENRQFVFRENSFRKNKLRLRTMRSYLDRGGSLKSRIFKYFGLTKTRIWSNFIYWDEYYWDFKTLVQISIMSLESAIDHHKVYYNYVN
jgi:hypothetical protein